MANLKLIKDLAQLKGLTIEKLAEKAGISTQAIHLMGRSGKTKMETFEKIAEILEVPPYVFYDDNFDVGLFRDYVVKGHHNPTSFFGPIYNGGEAPFSDKNEEETAPTEVMDITSQAYQEAKESRDQLISVLKKHIEDLRMDKEDLRSTIQDLKEENAELKRSLAELKK